MIIFEILIRIFSLVHYVFKEYFFEFFHSLWILLDIAQLIQSLQIKMKIPRVKNLGLLLHI